MTASLEKSAVQVIEVVKRYAGLTVLNGVSLDIPKGAFLVVLGPVGSGKSSLLRIVSGVVQPDSGDVLRFGRRAPRNWSSRPNVGVAAPDIILPQWMTPRRLLAFWSDIYPSWDRVACASLMKEIDLPWDRPIRNFSRGMYCSIGLVSLICSRAPLLLADEPFASLDRSISNIFFAALRRLRADRETTFVVVQHAPLLVENEVTHICILRGGRVDAFGTREEILNRYRIVDATAIEDRGALASVLARRMPSFVGGLPLLLPTPDAEAFLRRLKDLGLTGLGSSTAVTIAELGQGFGRGVLLSELNKPNAD